MRSLISRVLWMALVALLASGCPTSSYLRYRVLPDYPRTEGAEVVSLVGLEAPVEVWFDELGVPHVDARGDLDLVRAVGFLQARERYFQMDLLRRVVRGRVSELVGEQEMLGCSTLTWDVAMRGWGFEQAADRDMADADADTLALVQAYVSGVNQALAQRTPLEYRLLGVEPEPWRSGDSFVIGSLQAWSVTHNWHQELSRLLFALHGGLARAEAIYGSAPWPEGYALAAEGEPHALLDAVAPALREVFPPRPPTPASSVAGEGEGTRVAVASAFFAGASNAWVVGGARSASGKPVLANDPHLSHLVPSLMVQQHLRAPGLDVIGVTSPGLPFVLAGHNDRVAWGMTSTVGDVVDLVIEAQVPTDPTRVQRPGGASEVVAVRDEVFRVRVDGAWSERVVPLRSTSNGPLINDIYPGLLSAWAPLVAIRWHAAGADKGIGALRRANRARSVAELMEALGELPLPVGTWTAADVQGRIACFATGAVPLREQHRGTFPVPGWVEGYAWTGVEGPRVLLAGVAEGDAWFAHGNNLMMDPTRAPVFVNVDSAPSYRWERIAERLEAIRQHTAGTLAAIQTDVHLIRARRLVPHMLADLKLADLEPRARQALSLLAGWDFEAGEGSAAAAIFFLTYREAIAQALEDELDPRAFDFVMSQRYSTNVADEWLAAAGHVVWDDRRTPAVERRADVLAAAFRRAVAALGAAQGDEPAAWRWGALHDLHVRHPFGGREALASLVNLPRVEAQGGMDSVWKSHFDLGHPTHPFRAMAGPVFRMVVDMADVAHGQWIIDTGASGWPGSPHYGDQHELWKRGELAPMRYDWDEIRATSPGRLTLAPPAP